MSSYQLKDIAIEDIQAWISFLETPGPKVEGLSAKTVSRKLTALGNFFHWLITKGVITEKANPMRDIANRRVSAPPLPEILFEDECRKLLTAESGNPRIYLLIFLFLETGIKLEELFSLKESHFDFSNKYGPEVHIKHSGKKEKKSRILKLPMEIITVFNDYVSRYKVDNLLFPYTQRFVQLLIAQTAEKAGIKSGYLHRFCGIRARSGSSNAESELSGCWSGWVSVRRRGRMRGRSI